MSVVSDFKILGNQSPIFKKSKVGYHCVDKLN